VPARLLLRGLRPWPNATSYPAAGPATTVATVAPPAPSVA
jgi:hypothetical protein